MKRTFIKRIMALSIISTTLLVAIPIGASAEWRQNSNRQWNYVGSDGNLIRNSWFYDRSSGKTYYLDSNGIMQSNSWMRATNGKYYYLQADGSLATNTNINGYVVGADGAWIGNYLNNSNSNNNQNSSDQIADKSITAPSDLENYLNENYSSLKTPIGTLKFDFTINENDDKMFPYDFEINTDWGDIVDSKYDLDVFDPSDLNDSIKISDNDKENTKELLKEYQKNVAQIAMKYFPNKKIKGGFYSGFYKYQYIRTGYESVHFYSWTNYDVDLSNYKNYMDEYNHSTLSNFQWNTEDDDYNLD